MIGKLWRWCYFAFLVALVAGPAIYLVCRRYHVYSLDGWQVYRAMQHECHPAWQDYNFGRVSAGDDVEDVIARTRPVKVERNGRWIVLHYQSRGDFSYVTGVAHDDKMVLAYAGSCAWVRVFFDELTEEQSLEFLGSSRSDPRGFGIVPVFRS